MGEVLDSKRDLYDQAFALLACSARIAAGDGAAKDYALAILAFINTELASPFGGWREDDRQLLPRRANPHMHLLEAFMALHESAPDEGFLEYAHKVTVLFDKHFFDPEIRALREFFNDDWSTAGAANSELIEPGHMMEWAFLLKRFC